MKALALIICAGLLTGCSYRMVSHEGGVTYAQLAEQMPRAPLRVALSSSVEETVRSQGVLDGLRSHPMVREVERADAEVIVDLQEISCYELPVFSDGPLYAVVGTLIMPVILVANPFAGSEYSCFVNLTYSLQTAQPNMGVKQVSYPYTVTHQTQLISYPLITSSEREAYQDEYLHDQVVARLLLDIEQNLRGDIR